jgi:phosphate/sulfate permease
MPISTTYCIIGGIVGVGLIKGLKTVRFDLIRKMMISLVLAPVSAFLICFAAVYMIRYLPDFAKYLKEIFAPLYLMLEPLLDSIQETLELIREPEEFIK